MAIYTDDFNRANNAALGASWTEGQGGAQTTTGLSIASNLLRAPGANGGARWNSPLDTDNHYCQLKQVTAPTSGRSIYLGVRAESDGRPLVTLFVSTTTATIYTWNDSGTATQRATASFSPVTGATYKFEANGYVYTGYHNGSPIVSWTDTGGAIHAPSSARRYVTVNIVSSGTFDTDDFEAADLADPANTSAFFAMF